MFLSREEVREVDRRAFESFGVPSIILMENAGRGCSELLMKLGIHKSVTICCGKGNNGGDGLVMARHLDIHHYPVKVLLFGNKEEISSDAQVFLPIVEKAKIPLVFIHKEEIKQHRVKQELEGSEWVVDSLFGTGLTGAIRDPYTTIVEAINNSQSQVLATDIPSGLDCDTGEKLGATVKAHHTASFVANKIGFRNPESKAFTGRVHIVNIGAPRICIEPTQ